MDFFKICTREIEKGPRKGQFEVYPDFRVGRSQDLMVRGKAFYAIWDEKRGLWSTDEYDVQRLVDEALIEHAESQRDNGVETHVRSLSSFGNNGWTNFRRFVANLSDSSKELDSSLTFQNSQVKKSDYVSRRLPYSLEDGPHQAWDELLDTLYGPEERSKIEWAIGSVVSGDSKKLQKFLVFYGPGGTGKSTILNIIQRLFEGYTTSFEAKALTGNNNSFATESFRSNPLVAIQHDGDLSKIEDNSKLNSIVSHEDMTMNEKYKPSYTARCNAFLFMGTNKPVRISDAKSGVIRRLIDVHPTGERFPPGKYHALMAQVEFELGAIAKHCLDVYHKMGKNYYNSYRPLEMMLQTDIFFNFIEAYFDVFKDEDGTSLKRAYLLYKEYCSTTGIEWVLPQYKFREELRNYFDEFHDRYILDDGSTARSYYKGFTAQPFKTPISEEDPGSFSLILDEVTSLLDLELADCPAQYANDDGTPQTRWALVKTTLADIDTSKLHYVKVPENHIVIDFDLKDEDGTKSREKNLRAASEWPPTYGEYSKSGCGIHLHYCYTGGDPTRLASSYSEGIEVKVFTGGSSLRRKRSLCNNVPVALINSGLPFKEKRVLSVEKMTSERGIRDLIARNLRKEIHPGTKPSIDFIDHILKEAYESGLQYDVMDLRPKLLAFANSSTHHGLACLKIVQHMRFKSDESPSGAEKEKAKDDRLVFFDVEVFPNLFVVCWKYADSPDIVRMINPSPQDIEKLLGYKLVGFNTRRYDNHILYARLLGYNNERLYHLSQKIIDGIASAMFGEAYGLSYADIFDFSSVKQTLKKFEIELGLTHLELNFPWDKPVDPADWPKVVEYCVNDVVATEAVFNSRRGDFTARQILAELSGLSVNDTTQKHTAKIIFGEDRNPQRSFKYTDLSKDFDGYVYNRGVSTYLGETVGEGGYVYAEPGMYENVALLDVASMHPTSIIELNLFGSEYTKRFAELVQARLAIKRKDYEEAGRLLEGRLGKFLDDTENASALSYALKIVINIVYGLTSAKFDNPFRDPRNKDNIVAKRGALFMIDLKHALQERGYTVAHIKTDSVKIPDADQGVIEFVIEFGKRYGYTFEHEATYDKFCLVNDAVYIARETECVEGVHWTAVGAQFQQPYVFKTLFSGEDITFDDLCETKQVTQGAMYLDHDGPNKPMVDNEGMQGWKFIGKTGLFVPVKEGFNGGTLFRVKDGKPYAVSGTKGYVWLEADIARELGMGCVDMSYFEKLAMDARNTIDYFGPFAHFVR